MMISSCVSRHSRLHERVAELTFRAKRHRGMRSSRTFVDVVWMMFFWDDCHVTRDVSGTKATLESQLCIRVEGASACDTLFAPTHHLPSLVLSSVLVVKDDSRFRSCIVYFRETFQLRFGLFLVHVQASFATTHSTLLISVLSRYSQSRTTFPLMAQMMRSTRPLRSQALQAQAVLTLPGALLLVVTLMVSRAQACLPALTHVSKSCTANTSLSRTALLTSSDNSASLLRSRTVLYCGRAHNRHVLAQVVVVLFHLDHSFRFVQNTDSTEHIPETSENECKEKQATGRNVYIVKQPERHQREQLEQPWPIQTTCHKPIDKK